MVDMDSSDTERSTDTDTDTDSAKQGETIGTGFIGPAQTSWVKFKLAGIAWKLTRGTDSKIVAKVPGAKKLAMWAFTVRVMSRDFDVDIEIDKNSDSTESTESTE